MVAINVPCNLLLPILTITLRNATAAATTVSMPEAAIDEKCALAPFENDVRTTGKIICMQPVSKAASREHPSYS